MRTLLQKAPQLTSDPSRRPPVAKSAVISPIQQLQRRVGHHALQQMLQPYAGKAKEDARGAPLRIQPKLTINTPGDIHEQEADRVSEQVMRMPESSVQSKAAGDISGRATTPAARVQTKAAHAGERGAAAPPIVHDVLRSPGQPLPASTRAFMEPRFGRDFGQVRVHTDAKAAESAAAINARAYTVDHNVVFGAGEFAPQTEAGGKLLAHELAHTAQQDKGDVQRKAELKTDELSYEELVNTNIDTKLAILENEMIALAQFYIVIVSASKGETVARGAGEIALESLASFVFDSVIDGSIKEIPAAKPVIGLSQDIFTSIKNEESRVKAATESYNLGQFVVKNSGLLANLHSQLLSSRVPILHEKMNIYNSKPASWKKVAVIYEQAVRDRDTSALKTTHSFQGLFKYVTGEWISSYFSSSNVEFTKGYMTINVDENWNAVGAYINAPGGQKIADELKLMSNNVVSLKNFRVPITLVFRGIYYLDIAKDGSLTRARNNWFATDKIWNWFYETYQKKGVPKETKTLSGDP
jgi:hypothetical protein